MKAITPIITGTATSPHAPAANPKLIFVLETLRTGKGVSARLMRSFRQSSPTGSPPMQTPRGGKQEIPTCEETETELKDRVGIAERERYYWLC
jgi:hypothetical protein